MAKPKEVKPLPETVSLSELERTEFQRQVVTKKWIDARFELAQRECNEALQALAQDTNTWAEKLARRLGIVKGSVARYRFAPDGTGTLQEQLPQEAASSPPEQG